MTASISTLIPLHSDAMLAAAADLAPALPAQLPLHPFFIGAGIALLALMAPALYRVAIGPAVIDRIVAINIIGTKTAVLLVIIGTIFGQVEMFVDFALAYALLNFIGSLAAARFLHRFPHKENPGGSPHHRLPQDQL